MVLKIQDIPLITSITAFLFGLLLVIRHLLFFGFAPFVPHRPEVIEKILKEINPASGTVFFSLGCGRSGFLELARKKCPDGTFIGVEEGAISSCISRLQTCLKGMRDIKVVHSDYYKTDLHRANAVYCYLNPEELRDLYKKLKLEPRTDAIIVSVGFAIPYLDPIKIMKTEQKKKWYGFLISHKKVLTIKEKEHTRDDNVYFYQV